MVIIYVGGGLNFLFQTRCLEFLGMRNVRELTGTDLSPLFQDPVRAPNFRQVAFSGSKHVDKCYMSLSITLLFLVDFSTCS